MTIDQKELEAAARQHDHFRKPGTIGALNAARNAEQIISAYLAARPAPDHAGLVEVGTFIAASEHGVGVSWGDLGPLGSGDKIYALREAATALSAQADDNASYDDGYQDGLHDGNGDDIVRAVAAWLDNHLGKGNWYDEAAEGFSADDVVQALNEAVREPATALSAASPAPLEGVMVTPTHRHKKRGTEYVLLGIGKMQAEGWHELLPGDGEIVMSDLPSVDMREVAVYRSATDPSEIWVRPREEFEDGRFEPLSAIVGSAK